MSSQSEMTSAMAIAEWQAVHRSMAWGDVPEPNLMKFVDLWYGRRKPRSDVTILDCGCGVGANSIPLSMQGYTVIGFDCAQEAILQAIRMANGSCRFVTTTFGEASPHNLQFRPGSLDLVVDNVSLQHVDLDAAAAFAWSCLRWLKPGGRFWMKAAMEPFPMQMSRVSFIRFATLESIARIFFGYVYFMRLIDEQVEGMTVKHMIIEAMKVA